MINAHAMILLAVGFGGSYLVAEMLGCNFFSATLTFLLKVLFHPFYLLMRGLSPLMKSLSARGFYAPVRIFNFLVDCVIGGMESVLFAMNKLGID